MGRRSSRPSGGRRPAPRPASRAPARSASTQTARRTAPPPAAQKKPAAPPAAAQKQNAPPPAHPPAQQGSAMGGFMANVASTGLGVMAGRAMDRALFGGGSGAAPEGYEQAPAPEAYDVPVEADGMIEESVCAREALEFKKCMERTQSSVQACQWNLDILAACQRQQNELGFAQSGGM